MPMSYQLISKNQVGQFQWTWDGLTQSTESNAKPPNSVRMSFPVSSSRLPSWAGGLSIYIEDRICRMAGGSWGCGSMEVQVTLLIVAYKSSSPNLVVLDQWMREGRWQKGNHFSSQKKKKPGIKLMQENDNTFLWLNSTIITHYLQLSQS